MPRVMEERLVVVFRSMVLESDFNEALNLIYGSFDEIPPPTVINDIVFKILMKNCEDKTAKKANVYLCDYLLNLEKIRGRPSRYDFKATLQCTDGDFQDVWCAFTNLVESNFIHYNICNERSCTSEVVKYPNCEILIVFFVEMLTEFMSLENGLFDEDSEKRFLILMEWINECYKTTELLLLPIFTNLHKLFDSKIKYEISINDSPKKMYFLANLILDRCPDTFSNTRNVKMFNALSHFSHLQVKIIQHKLHECLYKKKLKEQEHLPLTLKVIVCNYFFNAVSQEENVTEAQKSSAASKRFKKSKQQLKKKFLNKEEKGDSKLHKLCRENKFGDLYEVVVIESSSETNARNSIGRTPLHVACLSDNYYCAKTLLVDIVEDSRKVDLKASDKYGLTPLHCAAYMGSLDIARMILKHGGPQLVTLKDNFGEKAIKYANSRNMKDFLESFESKLQESTSDFIFDKDNFTVPTMKDIEEYSTFIYELWFILYTYLRNSKLLVYKSENLDKLSHEQHKCSHYVSLTSAAVCDDDLTVFRSLPQILDNFFARIQCYTKEIGIDIQRSLNSLIILKRIVEHKM